MPTWGKGRCPAAGEDRLRAALAPALREQITFDTEGGAVVVLGSKDAVVAVAEVADSLGGP